MTIGVVIHIAPPYFGLAWRLVPASLLSQYAAPTISKQLQHQLAVLEEPLKDPALKQFKSCNFKYSN
jgi:hypothetical protein